MKEINNDSKFDRSAYAEKSFKEADNSAGYWRTRPMWERLRAGYHLSLRAYGYDPEGPHPKLDKKLFSIKFTKKDC